MCFRYDLCRSFAAHLMRDAARTLRPKAVSRIQQCT